MASELLSRRGVEAIEFDAWLFLSGVLASRLAGSVPGLVIDLIGEADRLDRALLPPTEIIEALGTVAVARGRRRRDVDRLIQAARKRTCAAPERPSSATRWRS